MQSWVGIGVALSSWAMASAGVAPAGYKNSSSTSIGADKLQDHMNELKIRDDKVKNWRWIDILFWANCSCSRFVKMGRFCKIWLEWQMQEVEATIINGKGTETGHIIVTTTGGKNGQPKQVSDFTSFD